MQLVLLVIGGARPIMVLEYVAGTPLSHVLAGDGTAPADLGAEVGRVVAGIGAAGFDRPGFFADERLTVRTERPWSQQLPEVAEHCVTVAPEARLDQATRRAWVELCAAHAPAHRPRTGRGLGVPRPRSRHVRPQRPDHPAGRPSHRGPGGGTDPALDRPGCTRWLNRAATGWSPRMR